MAPAEAFDFLALRFALPNPDLRRNLNPNGPIAQ
jgi:hypothetical protein